MLFHDQSATVTTYNATLYLTLQTCINNTGGFNCSAVATQFNQTADSAATFVIPPSGWRYFYTDFAPSSNGYWDLTASGNTSGTMYIRRGGYSDASNYENSDQYVSFSSSSNGTKYITAQDTYIGGRWYVAIQNTDSTDSLGFKLYSSLQQAVTPTAPPTQVTRTTPVEPTSPDDDSSSFAVFLMPSAVVSLMALFAALF
jgi:hypothetical protein